MYSVYQHWDKLKVCIVGRSYPPEFYSYISNSRVRNVMERIAIETEEDYQKLISLLKSFNVEVLRPELKDSIEQYFVKGKYVAPPMTPRDYTAMIGNTFYTNIVDNYENINENIGKKNKIIYGEDICSASVTRIGRDLYLGTPEPKDLWRKFKHSLHPIDEPVSKKFEKNFLKILKIYNEKKISNFPDYRCHVVDSEGHLDGTFCPVIPGLIISLNDIQTYEETFPNWEVVYLPNQSWDLVKPFLNLKSKNKGKWWVPGEELNDDFTDFVEVWLTDWVGYVEESVFDVNMLVIDKKNVVCNNYNKTVFDAFERYGITAHIVNFRHRFFWDGGLHCITSDIDREGVLEDYFPERGSKLITSS
jgi:hypothetical protein